MTTLAHQAKKGRQPKEAIPQPYEDVGSLYRTVLALKEMVEVLSGQRGQAPDIAVTWQDLLDLQLVRKEDIPYDLGSHPFR